MPKTGRLGRTVLPFVTSTQVATPAEPPASVPVLGLKERPVLLPLAKTMELPAGPVAGAATVTVEPDREAVTTPASVFVMAVTMLVAEAVVVAPMVTSPPVLVEVVRQVNVCEAIVKVCVATGAAVTVIVPEAAVGPEPLPRPKPMRTLPSFVPSMATLSYFGENLI